MKTLLSLALLFLVTMAARAEDWMVVLRNVDVTVKSADGYEQDWTLDPGEVYPVVRFVEWGDGGNRRSFYEKADSYTAVLRFGGTTFTLPFTHHNQRAGVIAEASATDVSQGLAKYQRIAARSELLFAESRQRNLAAQQHRDANDIKTQLQILQWDIDAQNRQRQQAEAFRQNELMKRRNEGR